MQNQIAQLVEDRVGDRKVAEHWFNFQIGNVSLCPWERHFKHIFHSGQQVYPLL